MRHRGLKRQIQANVQYVKDLPKIHPSRVGIIPYVIRDDIRFFALGIDTNYQEATDFGGKTGRFDQGPLQGALREFREETLGVFPEIDMVGDQTKLGFSDSLAVWNQETMILFVKFDVDPTAITEAFDASKVDVEHLEVSRIIWARQDIFQNIIDVKKNDYGRLYSRVRRLLRQVDFFDSLL